MCVYQFVHIDSRISFGKDSISCSVTELTSISSMLGRVMASLTEVFFFFWRDCEKSLEIYNFNTQIGENLCQYHAVMLTRVTANLYSWVKVNFTAAFVINMFHKKVYKSQFVLFATWFIRALYLTDFSNLSGDWIFIKLTASLNKL